MLRMSSPVKITQLMLSQGFGGAERHFVDLILSLADKGYRIQAISHPEFSKNNLLEAHPNVQAVSVKARGWPWNVWNTIELRQEIARFSPQIVHTHLARGAKLGGWAAHALGIPCVVNLHNYVNLKYYKNIDRFIAATQSQRQYLREKGIADEVITVMPHFSRLPAVAPVALPTDWPLRFIALGRLVKKKGFDVLITAFKQYLDAGHKGTLILGGEGPEMRALKQLASESGVSEYVEFSGWVDDIAGFLARGDVFVLPSLDEPFGIVVLEAMASGRPIISTRTQGPITILDEETALFVEIGDSHTLEQAMRKVDESKAQAQRMAEIASDRYQTTFSTEAVVPQVEEIYRQLSHQ
jgi:glycosyltransferase involved in cell wall biosynthesis